MRPCDCKSLADSILLNEQGISNGHTGIEVDGSIVKISIPQCVMTISVYRFKQWAEWFLSDQSDLSNEDKITRCIGSTDSIDSCKR